MMKRILMFCTILLTFSFLQSSLGEIAGMHLIGQDYDSPDILNECLFLRVLADTIQIDNDRIDLTLTFIASKEQDRDCYVFDPRVNGVRTDLIDSGSTSEYSLIHVDAGSSTTHTFSFSPNGEDALEEVSFRLIMKYNPTLNGAAFRSENGIMVIDPSAMQDDSGEERWEYTQRIVLGINTPTALSDHLEIKPSDMNIQAGSFLVESSYRGLILNSLTPIATELDEKPTLHRVTLKVPEDASDYKTALLLRGTMREDNFELSALAVESWAKENQVSFVIPYSDAILAFGEEKIPIPIGTNYNSNDLVTYIMTEIQLLSSSEKEGHRFVMVQFDDHKLTHVDWYDGSWPVELADHVLVMKISANLEVGTAFQTKGDAMIAPVTHLPMKLDFKEAGQKDMYVVYLDDEGIIISIQTVKQSELGETITMYENELTDVKHYPYGSDRYYLEYQYGDWIGWYTGEGDEFGIVRYVGNQTDVIVPSEVCGMVVTSIGEGALDNAHIQNITFPSCANQLGFSSFEELPTSEMKPLRDTMTYEGPLSDFNLTPLAIHERLKFRHVVFEDTESLWIPPLMYSRLKTGEWTVANCSPSFKNVLVPSVINDEPVLSIAQEAFVRDATDYIRSVDISNGIETIGARAFAHSSLTEITLPETLNEISPDAFENCGMLGKVIIRCDLDVLPDGLFDTCPLLHKDPTGIILPSRASEAQIKHFSESFGLPENYHFTRDGEVPVTVTESEDISSFFGKWVEKSTDGGMQILGISIFDNGVYSSHSYGMSKEGQWTVHGNILQTEDAVMYLEDDTHMVYYSNQFRGKFEKDE